MHLLIGGPEKSLGISISVKLLKDVVAGGPWNIL